MQGNILIVDDSADNIRLLFNQFSKKGLDVRVANSGSLALEMVEVELPDLIILDIKMSGMDGFEVCSILKSKERLRDIPVIFISALSETNAKVRAFQSGGVDFITKPFHEDEVFVRVKTHLDLYRLKKDLQQLNVNLEKTVGDRTKELRLINEVLKQEIKDRKRIESELKVDIKKRKRTESKLEKLNRALRMLSDCNQLLIHFPDELKYLKEVCRIIVEVGGYRMAWVGSAENDKKKRVRVVTRFGSGQNYLDKTEIRWDNSDKGQGPTGMAIKNNRAYIVDNIKDEKIFEPWRSEALAEHFASSIALPIMMDTTCYGALNVYSSKVKAFDLDEVKLLEELVGDISIGIRNLRERKLRHKFEEELIRSETKLIEAQRITHLGHWELDLATNEILWSDEVCRIFKADPSDSKLNYEIYLEMIHPDDKDEVDQTKRESIKNKIPYVRSYRVMLKNGDIKHVCERGKTEYDAEGVATRLIGTIQDITINKETDEALIEAIKESTRFSTAIEQTDESIVITDVEGTIQYANPAFEKLTDYSREESLGMDIRKINSDIHEDGFFVQMLDDLAKGNVWHGNMLILRKSGGYVEIEQTITPVKDEHDKIVNHIFIQRNVTEEKKIKMQLRQAQKMEAIGTLAGGIAHDFNNILYALIGFLNLSMEDGNLSEKIKDYLSEALIASNRAKDLVQQILAFSRQQEKKFSHVSLTPIVKEVIKLLRSTLPTSIKISQSIDSNCPKVYADQTQIHQILMNLCTNGEFAMRQNGGELIVSLAMEHPKPTMFESGEISHGKYVKLSVRDTGTGIDEFLIDKIFDPFFTTKPVGEGTGLGLSVVHGIVKNHQGVINVSSKLGEGSVFDIYLPVSEEDELKENNDSLKSFQGKERILVVDDEKPIAKMTKIILEKLGYVVTVSTKSLEALEIVTSSPDSYDLVILDQTMPELTGDKLARKIVEIKPHMPVILMTGFSHILNEKTIKESGIKKLIYKPTEPESLCESVREVLDHAAK
ncbi:MAG: response regulator [Deltaproteobacteria bacterium]|nr:response regulator [Deltaproteobacteria bacterium]